MICGGVPTAALRQDVKNGDEELHAQGRLKKAGATRYRAALNRGATSC